MKPCLECTSGWPETGFCCALIPCFFQMLSHDGRAGAQAFLF